MAAPRLTRPRIADSVISQLRCDGTWRRHAGVIWGSFSHAGDGLLNGYRFFDVLRTCSAFSFNTTPVLAQVLLSVIYIFTKCDFEVEVLFACVTNTQQSLILPPTAGL